MFDFDVFKKNLADMWNKTRQHQVNGLIDPSQVDEKVHYIPIQEGLHYVRLVLAEMYLADETNFFQQYFPAVHATTQFTSGTKPVSIVKVAETGQLGQKKLSGKGAVIAKNYPLTPLIPFNSDFIEFDAGLIALKGGSYLDNLLSVLSDFSSLVAVPQFSQALDLAGPIAKGVKALFDIGEIQLLWHDALNQNSSGGYYVAVHATEQQIPKKDLRVVGNSLRLVNSYDRSQNLPFEGYDYMLLRIEVTQDRADWDSLEFIKGPLAKMDEALLGQDEVAAKRFYGNLYQQVQSAAEFTRADRVRVVKEIQDHYRKTKDVAAFSGLNSELETEFVEMMKNAWTPEQALAQKMPSMWDILKD